ncbi:MAG: hypothetical protein WHU54_00180 [Candidatus Bathyarchaeia archaeon]|jgi:hypothetical protein
MHTAFMEYAKALNNDLRTRPPTQRKQVLTDLSSGLLLDALVNNGAAAGTVYVEAIRMIAPTADSSALLGGNATASLAPVRVLAVPQPGKKPFQRGSQPCTL